MEDGVSFGSGVYPLIQKNLFLEDGIQYMRENGIKGRVSRTHKTELVSFKGFKFIQKSVESWNTFPSGGCPFKIKKESRYAVSIFHKLIIINTIFYLLCTNVFE